MTRPMLIWTGSQPPTRRELRAIGRAYQAGLIPAGARVSCERGERAALLNPTAGTAAARGHIRLLKYDLRKAREQSRADVGTVRRRREASRPKLAAQVKRYRAGVRDQINEEVTRRRKRHRSVWAARVAAARGPVREAAAALEAKQASERDIRKVRAAERRARQATPPDRRVARFAKAESDFEVQGNIPPDLVPIWRRVKNRIRTAYAHKSRTEAFLEWAAENAREVALMQAETFGNGELEAELAAQEAAYYEGAA